MECIIKNADGSPAFRIRPYGNELCWQVDEWKAAKPKDGEEPKPPKWVPMECYPSTLGHARRFVYRTMAKRSMVSTDDPKVMLAELRAIADRVLEGAS